MEITKIDSYYTESIKKIQEQSNRLTPDSALESISRKASPGIEVFVESDKVQLSKGYQGIAQINGPGMAPGEVRSAQVSRLYDSIASHAYRSDPNKTSEKMLQEVF